MEDRGELFLLLPAEDDFLLYFYSQILKTDIIPACIILKFHTHGSDPSISKPLPINLLALKEYS